MVSSKKTSPHAVVGRRTRAGLITIDVPVLGQYSVIGSRSIDPGQKFGFSLSDATTRTVSPPARGPSAIGWLVVAFSLLSTKTDLPLTKTSRSSSTLKD